MHGFIRTACAVPPVSVGNVAQNTEEILKMLKTASDEKADIVLFPELSISGYTCGDLFFQTALQRACALALSKIAEATAETKNTAAVGVPLLIQGQLYNCAAVIACGKVFGIVPKTFLPNYNEFYEKRWFSSAEDLPVSSVSAKELGINGDYEIPVGKNLIFSLGGEVKFGIEICEDLWTPIPPGSYLALNGAELMLNLSASNETIAKRDYCRSLVGQQSARTICGYAYTSAGASESTTDLVFSGHTIITENGRLIAENSELVQEKLLFGDIDMEKIKADRLKIKSFKDSAKLYGSLLPCKTINIPSDSLKGDGTFYHIEKTPFVPNLKSDRQKRCLDIFKMQTAGLKKRLSIVGGKAVIGVSGGLDSTLALLVCAAAMKEAGKPMTDVYGITMPCFGTSDRTYGNSLKLMRALGISMKEINIKDACLSHFKDIGHDANNMDLTYENSQARERTQVLMDFAGEVGGIVVGTGDLSELALGWCTYNADHMSMYGVNAGVPKTLVKWMIESIIEYNIFPEATEVLRDITDTPISPELLPPDKSGNIAQETESIIGPYVLHDFFLYNIVRYGFSPSKVYYLAKRAFKDDYSSDIILKWLKNFYKRFFSQQFKRSCLPDGIKIGSICLSPRGDWRMPSDASAALWLSEVENIK